MSKAKRLIAAVLSVMFIIPALAGCGNKAASAGTDVTANAGADDGKINVVTTIFPEYDWVMNILGDKATDANVTMLLDNGVDLHSFQPTAEDIMKIADSDIFIYVGGESDGWVDDALAEATNKDMIVINLLEVLGDSVKEEEVVEGMQAEDEHDHDHGEDEDADEHDHDEDGDEHEHEHDEEEPEYDEHVWLSLKSTQVVCDAIEKALETADPDDAAEYQSNLASYKSELSALDAEYEKVVADAKVKTILFGDRFPFRYMVDDYGLDYYAAFVGCSAESEASFETVIFLAGKVDELNLPAILTIEGADHKIAETVRENTTGKDAEILTMNSMQSVTSEDVKSGVSYINIMKDNLTTLKKALGE
ncbi:MAG: metal ABC transporter substrate-binding protein [Lachnospiraceae bacterium]|nr:metal ABC transporter substrate-binding protein [Lachnospiraceae bacterium]